MTNEHVLYKVKPRLGEILKERDIRQTKLAEMAKIPQSAISRFDKNAQHKDEHLIAISRALGITIEELFHVEVKEGGE
ncbi:helix-turn-helix domain-containing protein [Bacillus seohaeanensis]|jgi:putative transcriptional regulator|uniref:Helix-turn-helix domain-containing protein n=1 Tax=Bacillus seohaeanensis TaxID=284580 RepID=A0ABW5RT76_9BACI